MKSKWLLTLGGLIAVVALLAMLAQKSRTSPRSPNEENTVSSFISKLPAASRLVSAKHMEEYAGAKQCGTRHPSIFEQQSASNHALTMRPMTLQSLPQDFPYPATFKEQSSIGPYTFRYHVEDGTFYCTASNPYLERRYAVEYSMGSGSHGMTFVSFFDAEGPGGLLEFRHSFFPPQGRFGMTPGHELQFKPSIVPGNPFGTKKSLACLLCHSTAVEYEAGQPSVEESFMGVTCEACHGPGQAHIDAVRAGKSRGDLAIRHPGRWPARKINNLCGQCHRSEETSRILDPHFDPESPAATRFAASGLMQSACYLRSGESLSCLTCHSPHSNAQTEEIFYEQKCLGCHTAAKGETICPVNPKAACIGCHMPRVKSGDFPLSFTDHWIRILREPQKPNVWSHP